MSGMLDDPGVQAAYLNDKLVWKKPDANAWQPIETAPRDGRVRVLLTPGEDEPITVGWYETDSWDKGWKSLEAEAWGGCDCCGAGCSPIDITPTHWMPLPEPSK